MNVNARKSLTLLPALLLALATAFFARAADDVRNLGLKDLMGEAWPEFSGELNTVMTDPRNEDAFDRMYGLAKRFEAEFKVPQYLAMLAKQKPDNAQLRVVLGLFYRELRDYKQALQHFRAAMQMAPGDYYPVYQAAVLLGKSDGDALKESLALYEKSSGMVGAANVDHKTRIFEEWGELVITRSGGGDAAKTSASLIWDRMIAEERQFDRATYERLSAIYQRHEMWDKARSVLRVCLEKVVKDDAVGRVTLLESIGRLGESLKDYDGANAAYREALALVDENHWLHKHLVLKLLENFTQGGRSAEYLSELKTAAAPELPKLSVLRDLSRALEKSGDLSGAASTLERALKIAPADVPILSDLLLLYARAKDSAASKRRVELYEKLIEIMPENFEAYVGLADTHVELQNPDQARAALVRLEKSASTSPARFLVVARAFARYGMKQSARQAYERCLAENPANADASMELCDFCLQSADDASLQRALELRDALIATGKLDETGYLRLGQILQDRGRTSEALETIGHGAINIFPNSFLLRHGLADAHYRRKEFYKAIQHYVAALSRAPSFYFKRQVNDRLVTLMYSYGRRVKDFWEEPTEEELKKGLIGGAKGEGLAPWILYLQMAISSNPSDVDSRMLLAQINETMSVDAKVGDVEIKTGSGRAKTLYKSVVDMDLKNLEAHAALARTSLAIDEYEEAVRSYEMLEVLSPVGKWQYHMKIGDIFFLAGDKERASKNWNQVKSQASSEPNLILQLGARMFMAGSLADSIELVQQAAESNRKDFRSFVLLGNLRDKSGLYAKAAESYRTALENSESDKSASLFLPSILERLLNAQMAEAAQKRGAGDFTEARQMFSAAADTATRMKEFDSRAEMLLADIQFQIARCDSAMGNRDSALQRIGELSAAHEAAAFRLDEGLSVQGKWLKHLVEAKLLEPAKTAPAATAKLAITETHVDPVTGVIRAITSTGKDRFWVSTDTSWVVGTPSEIKLRGPISAAGEVLKAYVLDRDQAAVHLPTEVVIWNLVENQPAVRLDGIEYAASQISAHGDQLSAILPTAPAQTASTQPAQGAKPQPSVRWIDRNSGKVIWDIPAAATNVATTSTSVLLQNSSAIVSLNRADGKKQWQIDLRRDSLYRNMAVLGDTLLLVDDLNNELFAYDAASGALRYRKILGEQFVRDPIAAGSNRALLYTLGPAGTTATLMDLRSGSTLNSSRFVAKSGTAGQKFTGLEPIQAGSVMLHLDMGAGLIWPLDIQSGSVLEPIILPEEAVTGTGRRVIGWVKCGGTLWLTGSFGRMVALRGSWPE
jgi:tetratricopeptide (TPR) repeat protein